MPKRLLHFSLLLPLVASLLLAAAAPTPEPPPHPLVWDAMEKSLEAKPGQAEARFEFHVTNQSANSVEILQVQPSCGCTVAEMPETPWVLAAGAKGSFTAVVDFHGKQGKFAKSLFVHSTAGSQRLNVVIDIPDSEEARRARNQQLATVDRQAVFRGDCAGCHVLPTIGKTGEALFQTACGICHAANPRATMVPDLAVATVRRDEAFWQKWISEGKPQSLMPAFAQAHGGPLTAEQIASLVEYAVRNLPTEPAKN